MGEAQSVPPPPDPHPSLRCNRSSARKSQPRSSKLDGMFWTVCQLSLASRGAPSCRSETKGFPKAVNGVGLSHILRCQIVLKGRLHGCCCAQGWRASMRS